ncbi:MAG TPA: T9SS type A sorting domain-containing protein, partial [Flavobacterium sp.]
KDMIDTSKFDVATLVPLDGSHIFETRISTANKVEFIFENIMLPFDDANNDGYVAFKIKTLPTLAVGDTFSNSASIYFDYNFPIVTNTATTTIEQLGTNDFEFSDYFMLYPNPAVDVLHVKGSGSIEVKSVSLYNTMGQLLMVISGTTADSTINVSTLKTGTYFLKINSTKGSTVSKFIKE